VIRRHLVLILAAAALVLLVWCLWLWQPARQLRRHTEQLLATIEHTKWRNLSDIIADDYSDRWGQDKALLTEHARQAFAQFFVITVKSSDLEIQESEGVGTVRARVALTGRGGPLADLVIGRAAELKEPFSFTWRQASWKPWDWKLSRIDQPELEIPEY